MLAGRDEAVSQFRTGGGRRGGQEEDDDDGRAVLPTFL